MKKIQVQNKKRLLICSDAKNEADDPFAIVHALLTETFDVRGLIATHFREKNSNEKSYQEIIRLVKLAGKENQIPILLGAKNAYMESKKTTAFIKKEIVKASKKEPLFILCLGALTDVANVIKEAPENLENVVIVWVGGGRYPQGSQEANLRNDIWAANQVFSSNMTIWQIPSQAYKTLVAPVSELALKVATQGKLGQYLYDQLVDFANEFASAKPWINSECWVLGDSSAVGVLLDEQKGYYRMSTAPCFKENCEHDFKPNQDKRKIRVYQQLNTRMILEDFFAKLALHNL